MSKTVGAYKVGTRVRHVSTDQMGTVVEKPADGYAFDHWSVWVVWDGSDDPLASPARRLMIA